MARSSIKGLTGKRLKGNLSILKCGISFMGKEAFPIILNRSVHKHLQIELIAFGWLKKATGGILV